MIQMVKLTRTNGKPVFVNPDLVVGIYTHDTANCTVLIVPWTDNEEFGIRVKEPIGQVLVQMASSLEYHPGMEKNINELETARIAWEKKMEPVWDNPDYGMDETERNLSDAAKEATA